jgi:mRNA interferase HicA
MGAFLKREGASHSLWTNPRTGQVEAVPRHTEIPNLLARKICRGLSTPIIGR